MEGPGATGERARAPRPRRRDQLAARSPRGLVARAVSVRRRHPGSHRSGALARHPWAMLRWQRGTRSSGGQTPAGSADLPAGSADLRGRRKRSRGQNTGGLSRRLGPRPNASLVSLLRPPRLRERPLGLPTRTSLRPQGRLVPQLRNLQLRLVSPKLGSSDSSPPCPFNSGGLRALWSAKQRGPPLRRHWDPRRQGILRRTPARGGCRHSATHPCTSSSSGDPRRTRGPRGVRSRAAPAEAGLPVPAALRAKAGLGKTGLP